MEKESFGPHLTMDLYKCNKEKLKDYKAIFNLLNDLPEQIGMTKITQPYVFPYEGLIPEDCGITGMVIIAESHISIHAFEEKDYVFVDIFSCKDFNVDKAIEIVKEAFDAKEVECNVVKRGLNFPRN
jgi:S-adenosylmethionine decarboxylase